LGARHIQQLGQAESDDEGRYRFNHLQPGIFYLAVAAQPWYRRYVRPVNRLAASGQYTPAVDPALDVAYPVTYYPGVISSEGAGSLLIRPGDRLSVDFDLTPVEALHVKIRNSGAEGEPRVQATFHERVFGDSAGLFAQAQITYDHDEMEVSGLAPGDYSLELMRTNGRDSNNRVQQLNLQGDSELDALEAKALEAIHGKISFDGGRPSNQPFLELRNLSTGASVNGEADASGAFKLQPEQRGRYAVSLANVPGYAIRALSATGARVSGRTIEISGTQPIDLMVKASEGVATIKGTVMNGEQPASGTMVVLVPQNASDDVPLFRRDQSDSDGTFTLREVVPGRYTAIAIQNGWEMEWASPEALRPYLAKGTPMQLAAKQLLEVKIPVQ
jgi:hypothetical protein